MRTKKIEAILEPEEFEELRERLVKAGFAGFRMTQITEHKDDL